MVSMRMKLLRVEDTRFMLSTNNDVVPENVSKYLTRMCRALHRTTIPDDWTWDWQINNGKYRGKLPRRLRNLCGEKRLATPIENVLVRCREDMPPPSIYVMDVTFNINWEDGEFGDSGSCYWLGGQDKLKVMRRCGFGALRRYRIPKNIDPRRDDAVSRVKDMMYSLKGYGRSWLAADKPYTGMVTIYNTYPSGYRVSQAAEIMCAILPKMTDEEDTEYIHRKTKIKATQNSYIYLNGDARVIGTQELIERWERSTDMSDPKVPVKAEKVNFNVFK